MVLLGTDLDRTIIFSEKFIEQHNKQDWKDNHICLEHYNGKPLSYVTKETFNYLYNLLESPYDKNTFIPITTRSIEQFKRINLISNFPYAITNNGGVILKYGKPIKEWADFINCQKEKLKVSYQEIIDLYTNNTEVYEKEGKLVDELFLFIKIKDLNKNKVEIFLKDLESKLLNTGWTFTLQGKKLYIIPEYIRKDRALLYLINNHLKEFSNIVITSGDGKLDLDLIEFGDINFIPINSEVYNILDSENLLHLNQVTIKTLNKELLERNYIYHNSNFSSVVLENFKYIKELAKFEKI